MDIVSKEKSLSGQILMATIMSSPHIRYINTLAGEAAGHEGGGVAATYFEDLSNKIKKMCVRNASQTAKPRN